MIRATPLTRRELLQRAGTIGVAVGGLASVASRAADVEKSAPASKAAPPPLAPLNRFPRMQQDWLVARVRAAEAEGEARRARLRTRVDAEGYARDTVRTLRECFGPLPEKTPLNSRVTGRLERDAYAIEKMVFESRPGFLVTANLYLPKMISGPRPAVLGTCGHINEAKAAPAYQSFAQGLARQGYVVLIFDPIGLGERMQYLDPDLKFTRGPGVDEHLQAGNQQFLVGENFAAWNAWDGIRALDVLLARPEVDARHVGVTGNSGGGTLATWLCALESRLTMAAPSCFVTTLRRNAENELPVDTEQCVPRVLASGLDHADCFAGFAPRPLLTLGQENDFFDARGLDEATGRLARLYSLLGGEGRARAFTGPTDHGYSVENREAMYRFFNEVTRNPAAAASEPALMIEQEKDLWCTPAGQVGPLGSRTVFSFTRERTQQLAAVRPALDAAGVERAVRAALRLPRREGAPEFRILRPERNRRHPLPHAASYAVETEPGMHAIVYRLAARPAYSRPPRGVKRAVLYVSHRSADAELRDDPWLAGLLRAEAGATFYACDLRGVGESQPNTCGLAFDRPYGADYFYAVHGIMLDRCIAAQRTHDLLRLIDWLVASGHAEVHLAARGWGAVPATFAALLEPAVAQITLKHALTSYASVAETEHYAWPLSALVPDSLRTFDLPDCYRALAEKRIAHIEPRDGEQSPDS